MKKGGGKKGLTMKILVIGPMQSGKSTITNFLAERTENPISSYQPTIGVRIVECEKEAPRNPKKPMSGKINIEFWDASGDPQYENCWPAIGQEALGVILVYNPDNIKQEGELEAWIEQFPKKYKIPAAMCICFAHHSSGQPIKNKSKIPKVCTNLASFQDSSIEEGSTTLIPAFQAFYEKLALALYEKIENEEKSIMQDI